MDMRVDGLETGYPGNFLHRFTPYFQATREQEHSQSIPPWIEQSDNQR